MTASTTKIIDPEIFGQLLEMDEPDDNSFSKSLVEQFFQQAEDTFREMDASVVENDAIKASRLGHFLKGSSASLGIVRLQETCQKIQQAGENKEDQPTVLVISQLKVLVAKARVDYAEARGHLVTKYNYS